MQIQRSFLKFLWDSPDRAAIGNASERVGLASKLET